MCSQISVGEGILAVEDDPLFDDLIHPLNPRKFERVGTVPSSDKKLLTEQVSMLQDLVLTCQNRYMALKKRSKKLRNFLMKQTQAEVQIASRRSGGASAANSVPSSGRSSPRVHVQRADRDRERDSGGGGMAIAGGGHSTHGHKEPRVGKPPHLFIQPHLEAAGHEDDPPPPPEAPPSPPPPPPADKPPASPRTVMASAMRAVDEWGHGHRQQYGEAPYDDEEEDDDDDDDDRDDSQSVHNHGALQSDDSDEEALPPPPKLADDDAKISRSFSDRVLPMRIRSDRPDGRDRGASELVSPVLPRSVAGDLASRPASASVGARQPHSPAAGEDPAVASVMALLKGGNLNPGSAVGGLASNPVSPRGPMSARPASPGRHSPVSAPRSSAVSPIKPRFFVSPTNAASSGSGGGGTSSAAGPQIHYRVDPQTRTIEMILAEDGKSERSVSASASSPRNNHRRMIQVLAEEPDEKTKKYFRPAKGWVNTGNYRSLQIDLTDSIELAPKLGKTYFCVVRVDSTAMKTKLLHTSELAQWRDTFRFNLLDTTQAITVTIFDNDEDGYVGRAFISLERIKQPLDEDWHKLTTVRASLYDELRSKAKNQAEIQLRVKFLGETAFPDTVHIPIIDEKPTTFFADAIRSKVSKKKRRFQEDGFDLDLSYVTDRVIAMGYPSTSFEGVYRNRMKDVQRFFQKRHFNRYKVYNLCSERMYDASKFEGMVVRVPFNDHEPCPFPRILPFCKDVHAWLSEHPQNVVAIHCKAGKGKYT